ncbi:MAG: ABC transporter ATP-binding protein [Bacteroidetes bacterium]|nr:ABC transporter ATP-binding protein [Bacteroidota bacterium]
MNILKYYIGKYKTRFFTASLNSVLNKVLDLMPPILVGWLVDSLSGNIPALFTNAGYTTTRRTVVLLIILTAVIFTLESFFEWLFKRGFMRMAQRVQHDVRVDVYDKLQRLPQSYFENTRLGNTLAILNDDVNQLERFLNTSFNELLQMVVLFIFASIALTSVSWELALIGMAPVPLIIVGSVAYQKLLAPRYRKMRNTIGALNSRLENNISGMQVVKLFNAEKFEKNRVEKASAQYRADNFSIVEISAAYIPVIRTFITIGFASGLMVASMWVMKDNGKVSLGGIALYAMLIQRLLWPVTNLGRILDDYERARASILRIGGVLGQPEEPNNTNAVPVDKAFREIRFDNVQFSYLSESPVLRNIDLSIAQGQSVGIVGPTGAGKTTLIKLLSRLYEPTEGFIRIDGRALSETDTHDWRSNVSVVNQDVYLFHGTIRENIAYGKDDVSLETIIEASKMAHLHNFVEELPAGYDSLVGERGIKLSGGQRQRLSLARAILKNTPLMILDEATSAVDTQTEQAIQENINVLSNDKTLIIIAHRLSTVRNADIIYVLDNGLVTESGTHDELIARSKGIYKNLWEVQTGETIRIDPTQV